MDPSKKTTLALLGLFVGSGCSALIYEIVWLQQLGLVLGATSVSLAILLTSFMGGMCLGSLALPRVVSAARHPLRVYAVLELLIGVCGLAILWAMPLVSHVYCSFALPGSDDLLARAFVALTLLLPPTILMGATLPAVARWVKRHAWAVELGIFYGANTFGAVIGSLLAGLYLLPFFDVVVATCVAAAINASVAAGAWRLAATSSAGGMRSGSNRLRTKIQNTASPRTLSPPRSAGSRLPRLGRRLVRSHRFGGGGRLDSLARPVVWANDLHVFDFAGGLLVGAGRRQLGRSVVGSASSISGSGLGGLTVVVNGGDSVWRGYDCQRAAVLVPCARCDAIADDSHEPGCDASVGGVFTSHVVVGPELSLSVATAADERRDSASLVGSLYSANTLGAIVGTLAVSLFAVPMFDGQFAQQMLTVCAGCRGSLC